MTDAIDIVALEALEALEKAATPGPWCRASGPHRLSESGHPLSVDMLCDDGDISVNQRPYRPVFARIGLRREEDTRFIVALRNVAPELFKAAKERDELKANLEAAEAVLEDEQAAHADTLRLLASAELRGRIEGLREVQALSPIDDAAMFTVHRERERLHKAIVARLSSLQSE